MDESALRQAQGTFRQLSQPGNRLSQPSLELSLSNDKFGPIILEQFTQTALNYFCRWLSLSKPPVIMKGWMYILECSDGSYYTGSTNDLDRRFEQHQNGEGANHTKKRLPVKLVYCEEFIHVADAFYREKQVQGWSRRKKEALIRDLPHKLPEFSRSYSQFTKRKRHS